ncbi:MAG TPA: hypothetical protein PKC28_13890 [Bdellovibrionales bacterium]|nr:hypothetical protein [Bdellovibrionales bacterium]
MRRWIGEREAPVMDCAGCRRETKCCAFQPFVPNYLVGGWLETGGALSLRPHGFWNALGFVPSAVYRAVHGAGAPSVEMACGFYDRGRCSLWAFRPGECSAYFCDGVDRDELTSRLFAVEVAVAQMALVELGFTPAHIADEVDALNAGAARPAASPEAFYKNAWSWSQSLTAAEIQSWSERLCGSATAFDPAL